MPVGTGSRRDLCVESFSGRLVGTFVQMPITVEDGAYARVAETVGDDLGVLALGDEERHLGAPQDVSAEIGRQARRGERLSEASDRGGPPERTPAHDTRLSVAQQCLDDSGYLVTHTRVDGAERADEVGGRAATRRVLGTGLPRPCAGHPSFRRPTGGQSFRTN